MSRIYSIGDVMKIRFNVEKAEELIRESGLRKGFIIKKLEISPATFGRWMNDETMIPLVKAAELADILKCDVNEFIRRE